MYNGRRYKPRKRYSVSTEQRIKRFKPIIYVVIGLVLVIIGYFAAPVILNAFTGGNGSSEHPGESSEASSSVSSEPETETYKWDYSDIRAAYIPVSKLQTDEDQKSVVEMIKHLNLNAVVIDIKREDGLLNYNSEIPLALETSAISETVLDLKEINERFTEADIFTIARVCCFKDDNLPRMKVEYSVPLPSGGLWWNPHYWLNPYNSGVREYLYSVVSEIAESGFCEIMLGEVNFPSSGPIEMIDYGSSEAEKPKNNQIAEFISKASETARKINPDIKISLNMDAPAAYSAKPLNTFDFSLFSVDAVSPNYCISDMIYNYIDSDIPIETFYMGEYEPGALMKGAIGALQKRAEDIKIRPFIQDFSPYAVALTPEFIKAQTSACGESKTLGFIAYNQNGDYTENAYN